MWCGILGHDDVVERFRRTLRSGRLASTYLFIGPNGIGKRRFAMELAQSLLCGEADETALAPCTTCESCRLFAAGNHPDFELVEKEADRSELRIELLVGDQKHRYQEGLCRRIALRPSLGRRKVAIIDDADLFSLGSANCLLKTLEEPPSNSLFILIGTSLGGQLPTIRSRSQVVLFRPLQVVDLQQILLAEQIAGDTQQAAQLAEASGGSVTRAQELADPELWTLRESLLAQFARPAWDEVAVENEILEHVQASGAEASLRRERLRTIVEMALDYYREQMLQAPWTASSVLPYLEACLEAGEQIDRYANQALVVRNWLDALSERRPSPAGTGD
jgi:DNA polymerase-3 subunit delta'